MSASQKVTKYVLATVMVAVLLGSALSAPTFSAFADKGKPKDDPPKNTPPAAPKNDPPKNNNQNDDDHKKGAKDPDNDKDKDNKTCKHPDTTPNGKYRHNCDSDHDFR